MLGEQVPSAEPKLEGVSQIDGNGDVGIESVFDGRLYRRLCRQHPRSPGQMHRHGVHVDARDREAQPLQRLLGVECGVFGGLNEMIDRLCDEGARPAGWVEDVLVQGIGHHLPNDGPRQPVRGVVLPQLTPFIGRDDRLVQDGGDVGGSPSPVESGYAPGQGP